MNETMRAYIEKSKITGWGQFQSVSEGATSPDVVIVGVPFDGGAGTRKGASQGPDNIRLSSDRMKTIDQYGYDFSHLRVRDLGDISTFRYDLGATIERISDVYNELFADIQCPILSLGGDHSITYPIVRAANAHHRIGLLWFDAHPDVLDLYHGSRFSHGSPLRRILDSGGVLPNDVLLIGTRAYDPGEPAFIAQEHIQEIKAVSFHEDPCGSMKDFRRNVSEIRKRVDRFYVSIDIDVLDDCFVPGAGTPVSGGISTSLLFQLLSDIPDCGIGYDVVEFAQSSGLDDITGRSVNAILAQLLSRIASGRIPRD
jgi:agmatinase